MPKPDELPRSERLTHELETHATPPDGRGVLRVFLDGYTPAPRWQPVVQSLHVAISRSEDWWYQYNSVALSYEAATGLVTASFSPLGVFDPSEQSMPAAEFLSLLDWMKTRADTEVSQPS